MLIMAKVWCAAGMCKWNDDNRCRAKEINLSEGHLHTVHQGFKQVWTCRAFEMSENAKRLQAQFEEILREGL